MSLTVKHLNADASFLLTFEPRHQFPPSPGISPHAFNIVLDPWLGGPSKIWHPKFAFTVNKCEPCVRSLAELPEPDIVLVSQEKEDHCHERTLKTLPASSQKTLIMGPAATTKAIRAWKYFDPNKIVTLQKWDDRKNTNIFRRTIPALDSRGTPGEVTITFLTQRGDMTALHNAIVITYRPPTFLNETNDNWPLTPPASPGSDSGRSPSTPKCLSVIFSPHGIAYSSLERFASKHLVAQAALPLTALLHCFDTVSNPWYLGGTICYGSPTGLDIAQNLYARAWISAHDGDKDTKGVANLQVVIKKFARDEVEEMVSPRRAEFLTKKPVTDVIVLQSGEELRLVQETPMMLKALSLPLHLPSTPE